MVSLALWSHPSTGEVRLYVRAKFERNGLQFIDGAYIRSSSDGHSVLVSEHLRHVRDDQALCGAWLLCALLNGLKDHKQDTIDVTFAELLHRVSLCVTKSGTFSEAKYRKQFHA